MTSLEIVVLALIQGLTEFLPISSSAHLVLPSQLLGWQDQGLAFDVAVHVGTLVAVVFYFRGEVGRMLVAWLGSLAGRSHSQDSTLAWWIILATIPAGLAGLLANDFIEAYLRSASVIAVTTIVFGLLLWWADARSTNHKSEYQTGWKGALFMGVAQAMALVPGTSRSGITITAGRYLGLTRDGAARFSFLMSIPVIVMAGGYEGMKLVEAGDALIWNEVLVGSLLSFVSALACIHLFLKLLNSVGMMPFVLYRLVLGVALFWFLA